MNSEIFAIGKIEELFNLEISKVYLVDYVFQVLDFTRNKIENNRFLYKLVLSDSIIKYENFVYIVDENTGYNLEINDLVKIGKVNPVKNKPTDKTIYLVDLSYFGKLIIPIGNPISYSEKLMQDLSNNNSTNKNMPPINGNLQRTSNNSQNQRSQGNGNQANHGNQNNIGSTQGNQVSNSNNQFQNKSPGYNFQFSNTSSLNNGHHQNNNTNNINNINNTNISNNSQSNNLNRTNTSSTTKDTKDTGNISYIFSPISQVNSNSLTTRSENIVPLNQITTFNKNFSVKVRILNKTELIPYVTKTNGVYLTMFVIDASNQEMEIKVFNSAAEKAHKLFEEKAIYKISGLYVKLNDKRYSVIKSDFCLYLEENFTVEKLPEDPTIKTYSVTITKIEKLQMLENNTVVDLIAKVIKENELSKKNTKHGEMDFKKIILADDSNFEVELSLWGEQARTEYCKENMDIYIFKHLNLNEFNGSKTLSTSKKSFIYQDNNLSEVVVLKNFFANHLGEFASLSKPNRIGESKFDDFCYMSLEDISDQITADMNKDNSNINNINNQFQESLNFDKKRIFKVKAEIYNFVHSEKNFYVGCSECRKKVKEVTYTYTCSSCNKYHEKPHYIYFFRFLIKDNTKECVIDALGEVANNLLGMTAEEYRNVLIENDTTKLDEIFPFLEGRELDLLIRPKFDFFNGETNVKLSLVKAENLRGGPNNRSGSEEYEVENNVIKID